jgi:hypothetical protein
MPTPGRPPAACRRAIPRHRPSSLIRHQCLARGNASGTWTNPSLMNRSTLRDRRRLSSAHGVPSVQLSSRMAMSSALTTCSGGASRSRSPVAAIAHSRGDRGRRRPSRHCHSHSHRHTACRSPRGGAYGDTSVGSPRCLRVGVPSQSLPTSSSSRRLSVCRTSGRSKRSRQPGRPIIAAARSVSSLDAYARRSRAPPQTGAGTPSDPRFVTRAGRDSAAGLDQSARF